MDQETPYSIRRIARYLLVACVTTLAGCTAYNLQPLNDQIDATRAAIKEAKSAGAKQYGRQAYHSAKLKLIKAEAAMFADKLYEKAMRIAKEAEVDAKLAEVQARTKKSEKKLHELQKSIRILQREIKRSLTTTE